MTLYPFLEAGKGEGVDSSHAPSGGTGQAGTILAEETTLRFLDLQNCNVTNLLLSHNFVLIVAAATEMHLL